MNLVKSRFLSTMSHEFRTPITAIRASAWLLKRPETRAGGRGEELLTTIEDQTRRLERLVADVLNYARLDSGELAFDKRETDLNALLGSVAATLEPVAAKKGVALELELAGAPISLVADGQMLVHALLNLVENAVKFTPGGGEVRVRAWQDREHATIQVRDTGSGIAEEHLGHVFERFFQGDSSTTREAGGVGLGLALCRAIVEDGHQGTIGVESRPESGSVFTVVIPLRPESVPSQVFASEAG